MLQETFSIQLIKLQYQAYLFYLPSNFLYHFQKTLG